MNIKFNYLYRDAGNYKTHGFIIFSNPNHLDISIIEEKLKKYLIDCEYFKPSHLKIPALKSEFDYDSELDHSWNEFDSLEETTDQVNDNRTINEFLNIEN